MDPSLIKKITLVTNNDKISAVKFLGVFFDSNLSFKYKIQTICTKLSKALFTLRMAKNIISSKSLKLINYSIFHCHIIYAIQIWSCCSTSLLNKMFKLLKAAVQIVCNSFYNSHTEPLFKREEILPLPDLVSFYKIQFLQRFSQELLPESFNKIWLRNTIRNIGENEIQLRNNNQFTNPPSHLALTDRLPTYSFINAWESFPAENLKIIRNKIEFDKKLKKFYLNKLSETAVCNRLYCPACSRPP